VRQILYFYDHLAVARRSVLQEEEPICIRQS
jgi:hypothetical protein